MNVIITSLDKIYNITTTTKLTSVTRLMSKSKKSFMNYHFKAK